MTAVNPEELHEQAMQLADDAFLAKMRKQDDQAISLLQKAASLEMEAANALPNVPESEPSRSILYRSAASLAYDAKDYKLADRLIASGLAGFPPPEVERELKNLLEETLLSQAYQAECPPGPARLENGMNRVYSSIEPVTAAAIGYLIAGDEEKAYEVLFYLHPDNLEKLAKYADQLSELCTNAISDYPEPDIGDE